MPKTRGRIASVKRRHAFILIVSTFAVALSTLYVLGSTLTYADKSKADDAKDKSENREKDDNRNDDRVTPADDPSPTEQPNQDQRTENHIIVIPYTIEQKSEERENDNDKDKGTLKKEDSIVEPPKKIAPVLSEPADSSTSFFLNPVPSVVENPLFTFSGTKPPDTAVSINSQPMSVPTPETVWSYTHLLSPGKNKMVFELKSTSGRSTGKTETEIIYHPQSGIGAPIVNIIKDQVSSNVKFEIEKTMEKKLDERLLGQSLEKLSGGAQSEIQRTVEDHQFSYITKKTDNQLSDFLSHNDQKEILTQNFGGPRINSPSHPSQSTWYSQNDVEIQWEKLEDAVGYKIGIGNAPGDPTNELPATSTEWKFSDLPDGVWYFSVKAKVQNGVTLTNVHRLMIDSTPPQVFGLTPADAYPHYKNGSLVTLRLKFTDNLFNPEDVNSLPQGLPIGFMTEEDLRNVISRKGLLPDFGRLIEADFSSIDSEFSKDRVMINSLTNLPNGTIEAVISYRISTGNKKGDVKDLTVLASVQDYVGNKSYATAQISLENNMSPVSVVNLEELDSPITVTLASTQGITLKGKSTPNSTIVLLIYSENPITVTVISDNEGNWTYNLKESLPAGNHTVYAYLKGEGAETENISQVAAFSLVTEVQAQEIAELAKPVFSLKPVIVDLLPVPSQFPSLPLAIKLALLLYALSFGSLIAALVVWYRENPPRNV